ncbi:hypothetical protein YYC_00006 [Plasmodium yoelii 17X]|uniref:Uncharacterized protein n=1 Tax=Plasmodium yoelii 17X TaxID=1323249 RepID=V7PV83_PLAYE|nr:hypothetical protein YYC_00006 [Plasmodium yoelii 17X]
MMNLEYDSNNKIYQFKDNHVFKEYCTGDKCNDYPGKINAACLYIFDAFFKNYNIFVSVAKSNINIVEYIIIWLSYMLNFIKLYENTSIEPFYNKYINNDDKDNKYNEKIDDVIGYQSYKDLIDKKQNFMSIGTKDIKNKKYKEETDH